MSDAPDPLPSLSDAIAALQEAQRACTAANAACAQAAQVLETVRSQAIANGLDDLPACTVPVT